MKIQEITSLDLAKFHISYVGAHHSDVMEFCVSFYLKDIKGRQNELESVLERFLRLSVTLKVIDYSKKLGVDVSSENHFEDKVLAKMEAYQNYLDVTEQVSQDIQHAKKLIAQIEHGYILWWHYVDGVKWQTIALREGVDRRTINRWRKICIEILYRQMPEVYRRYSIPDALLNEKKF